MKLTKREKVLLFGALIIVVVTVFITYIYLPLTKEIETLQVQSEDFSIQLQEAQAREGLIKEMEKQLITVQDDVKTKHGDILKVWDQAELLVFVERSIDELCNKESIDFFDTVEVDKVLTGDIGIRIKTNYENLQKIWDKFENAKYFNTVTSFKITDAEGSSVVTDDNKKELEVTMNIRFYSQNLINEYSNEYDFMDGGYGKTNIFN